MTLIYHIMLCWRLAFCVFCYIIGEKQTVKYVKNSELKRICYKEPFRGNSDCLATYAGWRLTRS